MDFFLKKQSGVIALHKDGQAEPVAVREAQAFNQSEVLAALVTLVSGSEKLNNNPNDRRMRRTKKIGGFRLYNSEGKLCFSYSEYTGLKNHGRQLV